MFETDHVIFKSLVSLIIEKKTLTKTEISFQNIIEIIYAFLFKWHYFQGTKVPFELIHIYK